MSQFTPGPWEVWIPAMRNDVIHIKSDARFVASVNGMNTRTFRFSAEDHANADLIARAPTLLRERDELREALEAARSWLREYHACHTDAADDGLHGLSEQMDAVLSKVTP